MEASRNQRKWAWNHDDVGRKIRDASLEKAEQMLAESAIKTKHQIAQVKSFSEYIIIRFYCGLCHTKHFWGGPKKYMMSLDRTSLCPKQPKTIEKLWMDKKFDNVHFENALDYAPRNLRRMMIHEYESKQKPLFV